MTHIHIKTPENLIGPTFVGKRVNFLGYIGTVTEHSDRSCRIDFDDFKTCSITMQSTMARWPDLISRKSFNYKPGDLDDVCENSSSGVALPAL